MGVFTAEAKKKKEEPKIDIYKAWCKACGICVAFCPTGALAKDEAGYPYVKDIDQCIDCGWCEIRCPDFAITVESKAKGRKTLEAKGGEKERKGGGEGFKSGCEKKLPCLFHHEKNSPVGFLHIHPQFFFQRSFVG